MTSSYERILRAVPISPRNYRIGESFQEADNAVDPRPFTVQEAERQHALELTRLRQEHDAALDAAYRRGHDEAAAAAQQDAARQRERLTSWLESLIEEFAQTRTTWFNACERQIVELIGYALEQILGDRPPISDRVARALRLAFDQLSESDRVTVRCHPDDLAFVQDILGGSLSEKGHFKQVNVVADPHIGVNGCLVETELGVVDARVEKRLAVLKNALTECKPAPSE